MSFVRPLSFSARKLSFAGNGKDSEEVRPGIENTHFSTRRRITSVTHRMHTILRQRPHVPLYTQKWEEEKLRNFSSIKTIRRNHYTMIILLLKI